MQREVTDCDERLRRLYRSIEDGIVELDDILRERTATLKSERERAKAALDRARAQCGTVTTIDSAKIDAFARLMNEKLDTGDTNARKSYIRSIVDAIEVDDTGHQDYWQQGCAAGRHCRQTDRERECSWFCTQMARPKRFRTPDPQIRSLVLYPAELPAQSLRVILPENRFGMMREVARKWRARRDFELLTPKFVVRCSIQLSYGR